MPVVPSPSDVQGPPMSSGSGSRGTQRHAFQAEPPSLAQGLHFSPDGQSCVQRLHSNALGPPSGSHKNAQPSSPSSGAPELEAVGARAPVDAEVEAGIGSLPGASPVLVDEASRPVDAPSALGSATTLPQAVRPMNAKTAWRIRQKCIECTICSKAMFEKLDHGNACFMEALDEAVRCDCAGR